MKKLTTILSSSLLILLSFLFTNKVFASEEDFLVETQTEISYVTGNDHVTVTTKYTRSVKNSNFYFPAAGEKIFHIPDISTASHEHIAQERQYKIQSITVKDDKGSNLDYSLKENDPGDGIYITIPNERATTSSIPYKMTLSYNSHDFITVVGKFVNIIGTSLPRDTIFEQKDEQNGTLTKFNYLLSIIVDEDIQPLSKAYPSFSKTEEEGKTLYTFSQTDRIGNSPYLEFGTSVLYRFELEYQTPKTDNLIPEKYSKFLGVLSTNIYEISLPREFSETNQKVFFESISPSPKSLHKDSEGNILALFEVAANKRDKIKIKGYITVEQDEWEENQDFLEIPFNSYLKNIKETKSLNRYLLSTKYWQSSNDTIKKEAETLMKDKETFLDIIKADYAFVNEVLEYDSAKATSENERIGALEALSGGPSVCMEYSDLMIALLRAQGIPSRAAIGYANLTSITSNKDQVRHQWVQIWVPKYGWLSVDPTFESKNMKIGKMVDRVLWEVFNEDSLSNIKIYSTNNIHELSTEGFVVKVYGVNEDVDLAKLRTHIDLTEKDKLPEDSFSQISVLANTILKTTTLGKTIVVTLPILIVLSLLIGLISLVLYIYRKFAGRKKRKKSI